MGGVKASPAGSLKPSPYQGEGFPIGRTGYKRPVSEEEALRLAEFIKDHDKRFEAKARADGANGVVLLTLVSDGTELNPISDTEQYHTAHIEQNDPGPTVQAAWEKWRAGEKARS